MSGKLTVRESKWASEFGSALGKATGLFAMWKWPILAWIGGMVCLAMIALGLTVLLGLKIRRSMCERSARARTSDMTWLRDPANVRALSN